MGMEYKPSQTLADRKAKSGSEHRSQVQEAQIIYGNGTCYVVDGTTVGEFRDCNFNLERMDIEDCTERLIRRGVVVGFGSGVTPADGIKVLRKLIQALRETI